MNVINIAIQYLTQKILEMLIDFRRVRANSITPEDINGMNIIQENSSELLRLCI